MSHQDIVDRVSIAWVEGRLENVLERQKQLLALHNSIRIRSKTLIRALEQDVKATPETAAAELTATLNSINASYEELNFRETLKEERALKNGNNYASFSVPLGPTVIAQSSFSPVFSTLAPLAAAVAAGNPTIVLSSSATIEANGHLNEAIVESLDREAVHFETESSDSVHRILTQLPYAVAVLQDLGSSKSIGPLVRRANPNVRVLEPYYGIPAGIVDRSAGASLDTAVEHIVSASLKSSSGNQWKVPRLYLVDESLFDKVKDKIQLRSKAVVDTKNSQADLKTWLGKRYTLTTQATSAPTTDGRVILGADGSEILLLSTRSLDHSIDLLNKINANTGAQAIYVFAGGKEAFYLGNFITASHVFMNQIPLQSLTTVAPTTSKSSITHPYTLVDFSSAKHFSQSRASAAPQQTKPAAKIQADKVKQYQGGRMSYFEQGLILGAAMGLTTIIGLGWGLWRGYHAYVVR